MIAAALAVDTDASQETAPIRVAVVDDSVVVRGLLARWLSEAPDIVVCGIHRNGLEALRSLPEARPDVLLLDIEMPEMDGLTALPMVLKHAPATRVVIVSSHSIRGADITLRCLLRGATDYLAKPSSMGEFSTSAVFRQALLAKVRSIGARTPAVVPEAAGHPEREPAIGDGAISRRFVAGPSRFSSLRLNAPAGLTLRPASLATPDLVLIAASTGGPAAIASLLEHLRPLNDLPPIVVAQHMPAVFTALLARQLSRSLGIDVVEVADGERLRPGVVHVCQGERSCTIEQDGYRFRIGSGRGGALQPGHQPADRMFETAAMASGGGVLGVVLTGMGDDGLRGARAIAGSGGTVLAQDAASSVVWGMPGSAAHAGLCSAVGNPGELAQVIRSLSAGYGAVTSLS